MNHLLETIIAIRKEKDFPIDTTNRNRYRIVVNEQNGTKTAYYFSAPIYNANNRKLLDLKFTDDIIPQLIGSNSQISFSEHIKMSNTHGNLFLPLKEKVLRISDTELHEGENIILPTTNGFIYKLPIKDFSSKPLRIKTDRIFTETRANNKYFALMKEKFTPFCYICAIGIEDENGTISSPFTIMNRKISGYEYEISSATPITSGKYFVFEINLYEKKLIQDTTVESANPNVNNAFGSCAYIGTTAEFGEQWLYSKIDTIHLSELAGRRINSVTAYIAKLSNNMFDIDTFKVSERFCSFGSNWENKKTESNFLNRSCCTEDYIVIDITNSLIHEKHKQIIATNGFILKPTKKNDFVAITTGDSCFLPQIIAINYH